MLVYFSVILKRLLNFVFSHLLCAKQKRKELLRSADAELNTEIKHTTSRRDGDDRECRGRRKHVLGKLPALALDDVEVHNVLVRVVVIVRARGARPGDAFVAEVGVPMSNPSARHPKRASINHLVTTEHRLQMGTRRAWT